MWSVSRAGIVLTDGGNANDVLVKWGDPGEQTGVTEIGKSLGRALERRRAIVATGDTDAFRVIDGGADGFPGITVDSFAGRWLVQTKSDPPSGGFFDAAASLSRAVWWKRLDQDVRAAPECFRGERDRQPFLVRENGVRFQIDLSAGYSQGLFLDQRLNRAEVAERSAGVGSGHAVLNLFAYTCGFSVVAAVNGATTTSLDVSQPYLEWGRRNFIENRIDPGKQHFCRGDALEWLRRWEKSGRRFHGAVADPPTFSRNAKGKVWKVESGYPALVERVSRVVEPGGWALFCTNSRGVEPTAFTGWIRVGLEAAGRRGTAVETRPMPPDFRGENYLKTVWVSFR